jgi:hypothetical protein
MDAKFKIRLSERELMYLQNSQFLPDALAQVVQAAKPTDYGAGALLMSREVAEQFRDEFTMHLAAVGFDADDVPTAEGKLLEDLIDRFFIE